MIREIRKLKFCKSKEDECARYLKEIADSQNIQNTFNPSFCWRDDLKIFSFRGTMEENNDLLSFLSIEKKSGKVFRNISADFCTGLHCKQIIDPKLATLDDGYYITFNSGWIPEGNNIYVLKVFPEIEVPKRVIFKHRQPQERNWAFFSEDNEIYALYSINPTRVLRVTKKDSDSWIMEDHHCSSLLNDKMPKDLTIGTQLAKINDQYGFVAHKKVYFRRKKIYFGRFCMFDFRNKNITAGKHWMVHSFLSLFGSRTKTNTNLFSCTYFSGIQTFGESIKLSYGVNDLDFGISTHKIEDL